MKSRTDHAALVDIKRRQAVKALGAETSAKQKLVSQALAALATGSNTEAKNHVTFDSSEDEAEPVNVQNKLSLFEDDDLSSSEEASLEDQLRVRPEYEGRRGQELMKRQLRITDSRFKLDQRFNEESDDNGSDTSGDIKDHTEEAEQKDEDDISNEKKRSIAILASIVGEKAVKKRKHTVDFKPLSRYDPSAADHDAYEVKSVKRLKTKNKLEEKSTESEKTQEPDSKPLAVSTKRFVEADLETLGSVFRQSDKEKSSGSAFTLFGGDPVNNSDDEDSGMDDSADENRATVYKGSGKGGLVKVNKNVLEKFGDAGCEDEDIADEIEVSVKSEPVITKNCFFFTENDPRLQAGVDFFFTNTPVQDLRLQWIERRSAVVEDYRQCRKVALRKAKSQSTSSRKNNFKLRTK